MSKEKNGLGKLIAGIGIGVGLGLLFAPKSGKETRADLKKKIDDLMGKLKEIDAEDVKETISKKVSEIKEDLKNLDKERVAAKIKIGASAIKRKAEDLVEYAKVKGTPVIEKAAEEVKTSTIKALEAITAKLKDEEPKKKVTKKATSK